VPNAVAMRIGTDHRIKIYNKSGTTHVIVDVTGWYRPGYPVGAHYDLPSALMSVLGTSEQPSDAPTVQQPSLAQWLAVDHAPSRSRG